MKSLHTMICTTLLLGSLCLTACTQTLPPPAETETNGETNLSTQAPVEDATTDSDTTLQETEAQTTAPAEDIYIQVIKPKERRSLYRLTYDSEAATPLTSEANMIKDMLESCSGTQIQPQKPSASKEKEIILCDSGRPEGKALYDSLAEGEFAIRVDATADGSNVKIYLAATSYRGYVACAEYLIDNYYTAEYGLCVPMNLDVRGNESGYTLITSDIDKLRDPCILVENGVYYAYGTSWKCYKNTSGDLSGPWVSLGKVASVSNPDIDGGSHWAPEVHKYNGAYYMFTTYLNSQTNHRGCTIMKSDSPEGPFVEITNGHITPKDWDAIDGTLYVDPDGQPWMVFVHEWTCMPGGIGSFAAAKLSDDFTHFISEPIELFKADEPTWAVSGVTDGCWLYTTAEGELLMLWSNFDVRGYVIAVARSSNGRLDGEWIHEDRPLYSQYLTGEYDGGHAMIFTATDGQMYLSFHSPNTATDDRKECPVFLAIKEEDGKLVWDTPKTTD